MIFLLFLLLDLSVQVRVPPLPFWGGSPQFSVLTTYQVNRQGHKSKYTAQYFYDWTVKAQRYNYDQTQQDQLCQQSGLANWMHKKCNTIYANDGHIYIEYPNQDFCCKCGNDTGAVRYDWLQTDTKYIGNTTINNIKVDHWAKVGDPRNGGMINNYYATIDNQTIVRFFQNKSTLIKQLDYDITTYRIGTKDPSLFNPPSNCNTKCGGQFCQPKQKD